MTEETDPSGIVNIATARKNRSDANRATAQGCSAETLMQDGMGETLAIDVDALVDVERNERVASVRATGRNGARETTLLIAQVTYEEWEVIASAIDQFFGRKKPG